MEGVSIPREFWREVPCGHPPDPLAALTAEQVWVCHCGWSLDGERPLPANMHDAPHPIVYCPKCGCHVGIPA